jgi:hypothetical protein
MKKLWLLLSAVLLVLSSCSSPTPPPPSPKEPAFKLDHFKMYGISDVEAQETPSVTVKDQILKEPLLITPQKLHYFCTPVAKAYKKKVTEIIDKSAYLAWYPYGNDIELKTVTYLNQFTDFKPKQLKFNKIEALMVPTEKVERGSRFPENLDHYLCYKVTEGSDPEATATLEDQFQKTSASVKGPIYFCVPCSKNDRGHDFPIKNVADHLAVYSITSGPDVPEEANRLKVNNQFGEQSFKILRQVYLLVPTQKIIP